MSTRHFLGILSNYQPRLSLEIALNASDAAVDYANERVSTAMADAQTDEALTISRLQRENAELQFQRTRIPHEVLVRAVLGDQEILSNALSGRKIQAIKSLRALSNAGLKECKDAVEDPRVVSGNL